MRRSKVRLPAPGFRRYSVGGVITISVHTVVEATSPEAARLAVEDRGVMGLCHQCASGEPEREWVTSGELDGDFPSPFDGQTELEVVEL